MIKYSAALIGILFFPTIAHTQNTSEPDSIPAPAAVTKTIATETTITNKTKTFTALEAPTTSIDTTKKINYWRITERTGEIIPSRPDTLLTDYFHRTNAEGAGTAIAYLGNLGLPTESRIFFERADRSQFLFNDPFYPYMKTPGTFHFLNTKIPHSNLAYQRAGSRQLMEERLQALLTFNVGKKINIGIDADYLYARGYYQSQSAKHLEWVFFGNYLDDRHQLHLFINPADYTNAENGGIVNDNDIAYPATQGANTTTRDIQTQLGVGSQNSTWNRLQGNRAYLNYHYNLGFHRKTETLTEEGDTLQQFIPVSSIIYTLDYRNNQKKFYTTDSTSVAQYYAQHTDYFPHQAGGVQDSTSSQQLSNTLALSLREGFNQWAKFDLTAFLTQDLRTFTTMTDNPARNKQNTQNATHIGGEIAKRSGAILRYHAQGSFGILGNNLGDLNLSGTLETRIPIWGDTASLQASATIKNLEPTYYEQNYSSRYFQWENQFAKTRKYRISGTIDIPHTQTRFNLGVENIANYIYFNHTGLPAQHSGNIQIIAARLDQNLHWKALHWDNQLVYQKTSHPQTIPLPDWAAYTSLYLQIPITVLTIQMGANAHYWTRYYAPSYEPALQQFKLQNEIKVGNYPLISAFVNCHLKQTRFFIEYYNAGSRFLAPAQYCSLPHYPVNPAVLKMGLSVDFIN
jgi:hypothetical protein